MEIYGQIRKWKKITIKRKYLTFQPRPDFNYLRGHEYETFRDNNNERYSLYIYKTQSRRSSEIQLRWQRSWRTESVPFLVTRLA